MIGPLTLERAKALVATLGYDWAVQRTTCDLAAFRERGNERMIALAEQRLRVLTENKDVLREPVKR